MPFAAVCPLGVAPPLAFRAACACKQKGAFLSGLKLGAYSHTGQSAVATMPSVTLPIRDGATDTKAYPPDVLLSSRVRMKRLLARARHIADAAEAKS